MEESVEPVMAADAQTCEGGRFGDRLGEWPQGSGVGDAPVRPVPVVVPFVLAEGV